jgi:hypothetical protein
MFQKVSLWERLDPTCFASRTDGRRQKMGDLLDFLLSVLLLSEPKTSRERAEANRRHSERMEAIRWLIYAVIALGVLMLIVAVSVVLLTG